MIDFGAAVLSCFVAIVAMIAAQRMNGTSSLAEKIAVSIIGGGALMHLVGSLSTQFYQSGDLMLLAGIAIYMAFKYLHRSKVPEKQHEK
jgi:hypothetical protein